MKPTTVVVWALSQRDERLSNNTNQHSSFFLEDNGANVMGRVKHFYYLSSYTKVLYIYHRCR